jgi:hypothetical protein
MTASVKTRNFHAEIQAIRNERDLLLDEMGSIECAPLPLPDVFKKLDNLFADNQEIPGLSSFFYPSKTLENPFLLKTDRGDLVQQVVGGVVAGRSGDSVDLGNLFVSLFGDQLKEKFTDALKKEAEAFKPLGTPLAERAGLIKALEQKIHALEVQEEALYRESRECNVTGIYRRGDVNPAIVFLMQKGGVDA